MDMSLVERYVQWIYLDKMDNVVFILCQENPDYPIRGQILHTMRELQPLTCKIIWRSYVRCMTSAFQWTGPLIKKYMLGQIETIYEADHVTERFQQYIDTVGIGTIWQHILLHDMSHHYDHTWKYAIILLKIILDQPYQLLLDDLYVQDSTDRWATDELQTLIDELNIENSQELQYIRLLLACKLNRVGYQLYQGVQNLMKILTIYDDNGTLQGLINYNFWRDHLRLDTQPSTISTLGPLIKT